VDKEDKIGVDGSVGCELAIEDKGRQTDSKGGIELV